MFEKFRARINVYNMFIREHTPIVFLTTIRKDLRTKIVTGKDKIPRVTRLFRARYGRFTVFY